MSNLSQGAWNLRYAIPLAVILEYSLLGDKVADTEVMNGIEDMGSAFGSYFVFVLVFLT